MRSTLEIVALAAALLSTTVAARVTSADPAMPSLAPLPVGSEPLDPHSNVTSFSFVFAGDNRPASASCTQLPPQLTDIVNEIKGSQASFVLWGGDIIFGKDISKAAGEYPG